MLKNNDSFEENNIIIFDLQKIIKE